MMMAQHDAKLIQHKNPLILRMNDGHHSHVNVGDVIQMNGHSSIMDRQRYTVVAKMKHPTMHQALSTVEGSHLSVRDKIQLHDSFLGLHGPDAAHHEVVAYHLEPHHDGTSAMNRSAHF